MKKSKQDLNKPIAKYHNYDTIPAKVFFDIMSTMNYQLLRPKNGTETAVLEAIYEQIYEDFFVNSENEDAGLFVELTNEIRFLTFKMNCIKMVVGFIVAVPEVLQGKEEIQEIIKSQIDALNKYLDNPIDFEANFLEEVIRVLNVEIGIIADEITIAESNLNDLKGDAEVKILSYYDKVAAISDVHGRTLDEKMLLPMYVALEKSAIAKNNRYKTQQLNGKR